MKKIALLLLAAFLAGPLLIAQNQNKGKKAPKTENVKTHKQHANETEDQSKDGNAYGKHKENLEGKEFGQSRKDNAQMSKNKNLEVKKDAKNATNKHQHFHKDSKAKKDKKGKVE